MNYETTDKLIVYGLYVLVVATIVPMICELFIDVQITWIVGAIVAGIAYFLMVVSLVIQWNVRNK